jgi:ketosteroid isomerase-like protein
MSEENVEIVRDVYSAWQRGNFAEGRQLFDPEIVFESVMPDSNERIVAHGPEGIEAFMREFLSQWRDYRLLGEDFRQVGTETVLVEGHQSGIGRRSGVPVESPMCSVWTFRNGKVIRLIIEFDRRKALKAAGLRE